VNHEPSSPASEETPAPTVAATLAHRRFGRRGLLVGAAASAVPLFAASRGLRRFADSTPPAVSASASPTAATVVASPEASPAASSLAPAPVATIGKLQVIDDQQPIYGGEPVKGGTLNLVLANSDNSNFSPVAMQQDFQIMAAYLDPLVWIDEVTMEPQPWLAKSWSFSNDGKTLTFELRDDVKWHDGTAFTADDVVFSLFLYRDDVDSAVRNIFQTMDFAKKIDKTTVEVDLNAPDGNFVFNAASQLMFQKKQYTKFWSANPEGERSISGFNWKKTAPVGTGPFVIGKRSSNSIHASRNDDYWQDPAHLDSLIFTFEPDTTSRMKSFNSGDADILWPVQAADLELVRDTPGRVYIADAASVMFAAFNFNNPKRSQPDIFSDVRIRRALSLAIDRDRYAKQVFSGYIHQEKAGTIAQPWANDASLTNPARDVDQAKSLLQQAGWDDKDKSGKVKNANGDALNLDVIVRNDARPDLIGLLQSLVADLAEVGVGLTVRAMKPDAFADAWINTHDFDLIAYAYNLYPGFTDFDLYGSGWDIRKDSQGWNPGGYKNDDVDKTIKALLSETSVDDLRASLTQLQQQTNDDLFGLWFGFPRDLVLVREEVLGYRPNKQCQVWDLRLLWRQANT
jgi:peptide/nickel transport system substrate-binding protein